MKAPGEGPQPPLRDGQRLRRRRAALPGRRAGAGVPAVGAYRFRKFARRNRAALSVGVLLALSVVVMVAGITAAVGWAVRDRAARDEQAVREFSARQAEVSGYIERILDEVVNLPTPKNGPKRWCRRGVRAIARRR